MLESLAEILLNLHRGKEQLSDEKFRPWALEQVRPLLGFDRAVWATGAYVDGVLLLHTRSGYDLPPTVDELWDPIKHLDETVPLLIASGGRMAIIRHDAFCQMTVYTKVWSHFGVRHGMGTTVVEPATGLLEMICFLYHDDAPSVSEEQCRMADCLVPHLTEAWRMHRLMHVSTHREGGLPSKRALMDRAGILHSAEHGFAELLLLEWPEWHGARLPSALVESLSDERNHVQIGDRLVTEILPSNDPGLFALLVRPRNELDQLTPREREIARLFASGLSHKEAAATAGISPATVRVHISAIYKKTGVSNKAALAALIAAADHPGVASPAISD